jgi:TonB family protein
MYVERYSDFDNGILDGRRTFWYNDGKVKADLFYKNDKKQGAEKLFYSTGQLRQKIIWNNDSIVSGTFFNEDGTPKEHVFKEDIIDYIYPAIPGYPGKGYNVSRFIYYNIQYPDEAKENNLQGTVVVGFALEPDGSVSNPHIIKSAGKILDDEVLRVMSTIPKSWPKKVNGIPVREEYTYSIPFLLID